MFYSWDFANMICVKRFQFFASMISTLLVFVFTPLAFAGGGGVYINTTNTEDPHWNIVRAYFDPASYTCKGMVVSFSFESPIDGDKISGSNGDNSSTINADASYETVNGKQYLRCSTYAKIYSPTLVWNRHLNVSFKNTDSEGSRVIATSFGTENYGHTLGLLPWEESYSSVPVPTQTPTPLPTVSPVVKVIINPDPSKCSPGPCEVKTINKKVKVTPSPTPKIVTEERKQNNQENNSQELTQKVASLEAQLQESKKEQSVLAQRVSDLVNFINKFESSSFKRSFQDALIKKLFPFFN